jgi:hypothetical protein
MKLYRMPGVRMAASKALAPSANAQKWEGGGSPDVAKGSTGAAPMAEIAYTF